MQVQWSVGSDSSSATPAFDAKPPGRLVMAQILVDNRQSNRRIELHAVHSPPLATTDKGP